jgi:xanthine dehydrogenase molybdopterin-binding subunit B
MRHCLSCARLPACLLSACCLVQVEGAFLQGLGWVLSEEVLEDPGTGAALSSSTWTYKPPGIAELPGVSTAVRQLAARLMSIQVHACLHVQQHTPPQVLELVKAADCACSLLLCAALHAGVHCAHAA